MAMLRLTTALSLFSACSWLLDSATPNHLVIFEAAGLNKTE